MTTNAYIMLPLGGVQRTSDGACIPFDNMNPDYRDYLAWVAAGNTATPYVAPVQPISVAMWQAEVILKQAAFTPSQAAAQYQAAVAGTTNLWDATTALIASMNNSSLTSFWQKSSSLASNDATLTQIATALGVSSAQITTMFTQAAALTI